MNSGVVSITRNKDFTGPTDASENVLIEVLENATDPTKSDVTLDLVQSDENIPVADPASGTLDVDDIAEYDNSKFASATGTAAHEIAEQTEMQRSREPASRSYTPAHIGAGTRAENAVNNNERIDVTGVAPSSDTRGFPNRGHVDLRYNNMNGQIGTVRIRYFNDNVKIRDHERE